MARMFVFYEALKASTSKAHLDALNLIDFERLLRMDNGFLAHIISDDRETTPNKVNNFKARILGRSNNEDALVLMHDTDTATASGRKILRAIFGSSLPRTTPQEGELYKAAIAENLNANIGSQNPIEIALSRDDELTLKWFHDLLILEAKESINATEPDQLRAGFEDLYCEISLSNVGQSFYLEYDFKEDTPRGYRSRRSGGSSGGRSSGGSSNGTSDNNNNNNNNNLTPRPAVCDRISDLMANGNYEEASRLINQLHSQGYQSIANCLRAS